MVPHTVPALLVILAAFIGEPTGVRAAQSPPMRLFGTATITGQAVTVGTPVQALAGSAICGSGTVGSAGSYQMDVFIGPPSPCSDGVLLTFTVAGRPARETVIAQPGAFVPLNLTVPPAPSAPAPAIPTTTIESVMLFPGCNNIVTTWPGVTPIGIVAGSVSPVAGLLAIWRYDAALGQFAGFAPQAVSASDLTAVNRLEPVFICMSTPGVLARPTGAM